MSNPANVVCDGGVCRFVTPSGAAAAGQCDAAVTKLLGSSLLGPGGSSVDTTSIAGPNKVVALYFSAHWCPPCRGFTPVLADIYTRFKAGHARASDFSIVFVSSDRDENAFKQYFAEMPWLALPYEQRDTKQQLAAKFAVSGIPTLIILDGATGQVITSNGRAAVSQDPNCNDFPWRPKPLSELMRGAQLVNKAGQTLSAEEALGGKTKLVYFSAHWCGPCRNFTPQLVKTYEALKAAGKNIELVFVSLDREEGGFKEYLQEMPWLALEYSDRARTEKLAESFGLEGIPTLIVVGEDDAVINSDAAEACSEDPEGAAFPWASS